MKPKVILPTANNSRIVTPELLAKLNQLDVTGAHRICFNPSLISTDTTDKAKLTKYSADLWHAIKKVLKGDRPESWVLPANPTDADRQLLKQMRQHVKARTMRRIRWLLVADCEVGSPNLMTGSQIYLAIDHSMVVTEDGLLTSFHGATARRPDRIWEREFQLPREFIDVTDIFWDQYLLFGRCAKNSMDFREADHNWKPVTRTSKRCACCGMWSYRRQQRTIVRFVKSERQPQERTVTQMHLWEHQRSKAFTNPYYHLIRNHPDFQ